MTWRDKYGTNDGWWTLPVVCIVGGLVVFGWIGTRQRVRVTRDGNHFAVARTSLLRRRHSMEAELADVRAFDHGPHGPRLRMKDGSQFVIGDIPGSREAAMRALLDLPDEDE
jgi:hypothetical protein